MGGMGCKVCYDTPCTCKSFPDRGHKLLAWIFIHAMMLWADVKEKFSRRKS
jgi:hypothetical protein